jgi:hypothetical protein
MFSQVLTYKNNNLLNSRGILQDKKTNKITQREKISQRVQIKEFGIYIQGGGDPIF